jgi:hypothetical protein
VNTTLLMSDARHFRVDYEINPYTDTAVQPDPAPSSRTARPSAARTTSSRRRSSMRFRGF